MNTKTMMNLFFHMDFFQDKKHITKRFYLLYTLMAGIYYESYVRQWFRYCTQIYLIFSVLFTETSCLITLSQLRTTDLTASLYSAAISYITLVALITVLIGYYWRKSLRSFIESVDKYSGLYEDYNVGRGIIVDHEKYFKFPYMLFPILFCLTVVFFRLITCYLTIVDSSHIDPLTNYYYPIAFPKYVNWSEYLLIYFLQSFFIMPAFISSYASISITSLISIYLKNQAARLTIEMKLTSDSITKSLDGSYEQEMAILETQNSKKHKRDIFCKILKERKLCYTKLDNHTKEWTKRHHKLILQMNLVNGFLVAVSSLYVVEHTVGLLSASYGTFMTITGGKRIEFAFFIPFNALFIFLYCINGHLYNNMTDDMEKEIYEMPWYYMPPKQRQIILNFLSIVQVSHTLKFFKVFPLMLELYPRILLKIFGYLQIIQVMEKKVQI